MFDVRWEKVYWVILCEKIRRKRRVKKSRWKLLLLNSYFIIFIYLYLLLLLNSVQEFGENRLEHGNQPNSGACRSVGT